MNQRVAAENRKERSNGERRSAKRPNAVEEMATAFSSCSSESFCSMVRNELNCETSKEVAPSTICDLKPFKHQVGGHAGLFSFGPNYVCKPFDHREMSFYKFLPFALRPFTAQYYHHISINKPEDFIPTVRILDSASTSQIDCFDCPYNLAENDSVYRDVSSGFTNQVNPWAMQCLIKESGKRKNQVLEGDFIILENITSKFSHPCVIDLKLGTRQHGDDATPEKKLSQKRKCAKSTSQTMGIRLCGLQYYDEAVDMYQCVDKYCGRELDRKGLIEMLRQFLQNADGTLRRAVCLALQDKLEELSKVLVSQEGLRLFSSSLLIVYDGDQSHEERVEVRLIDFAHATFPQFLSDQLYKGPDRGCLLGLSTLSDVIYKFLKSGV